MSSDEPSRPPDELELRKMQPPGSVIRTTDLLRTASVELPPRADPRALTERFPPGTDVYLAFLPADDPARIIQVATAVRRAGYNPVPHVAAHEIASPAALDDFLARATAEADVERILVIAGDSSVIRGPYPTSSALLESGLLQRHHIAKVDVAGHPEGNVHFTAKAGIDTLAYKAGAARRAGLDLGVVTQFCFEAALLVDWLKAVHRRGLDVRLRIGLAGPASLPALMKFALRCGIGNSMRALRPNIGRFGRLLTDGGPGEVVDGIVHALPELEGIHLESFHFFAFGGLEKSGRWIADRLAGQPAEFARS